MQAILDGADSELRQHDAYRKSTKHADADGVPVVDPRFYVPSFEEKYHAALQYEAFSSCFALLEGKIQLVGFTSGPTKWFASLVEGHDPRRVMELIEIAKIWRVYEFQTDDLQQLPTFSDDEAVAEFATQMEKLLTLQPVDEQTNGTVFNLASSLGSALPTTSDSVASTSTFISPPSVVVANPYKVAGDKAEVELKVLLAKYGIHKDLYRTEEQLNKTDVVLSRDNLPVKKTPDILFHSPVKINGYEVNWIDSKGGWLLVENQKDLRESLHQMVSYLAMFGPGMVIWKYGFFPAAVELFPEGIVHASRRLSFPPHLISRVSVPQPITMEFLWNQGVALRKFGGKDIYELSVGDKPLFDKLQRALTLLSGGDRGRGNYSRRSYGQQGRGRGPGPGRGSDYSAGGGGRGRGRGRGGGRSHTPGST